MKKILTLLFVLISFLSFSQVTVVGKLTTQGVALYPTHSDSLALGGYRVCYDTTERNSITCLRRKYGMAVYTQKDTTLWILRDSSCVNTWVKLVTGGGASSIDSAINASYGLNQNISGTTKTFKVDSTVIANLSKVISDSVLLRGLINANTASITSNTSSITTNLAKERADSNTIATGIPRFNDISTLPETNLYFPAMGISSSNNVTNYTATSVDSVVYYFSTSQNASGSTDYGGWLSPSASGDSIKVTAPFWVIDGDSQAEGHGEVVNGVMLHGRLHPFGVAGFNYNYPDSAGQLSYELRTLTHMRFYNQGIGGQTSTQIRLRFLRDALGFVGNPSDGRATQTLGRMPQGVVIIAGINDPFNSISPITTEQNLAWMAAQCQQYGVKCVILNLPGDAVNNQTALRSISSVNVWLKNGGVAQYGASVVDYNSWWNDPTYGNDNVHHQALIADDIHPNRAGYVSLASYIVSQANLPILSNIVVQTALSPSAPITNFARPTGITINGTAYTLPNAAFDTIPITSFIPDTVWIKITSSTTVVGAGTQSGFSSILWNLKNNPTNKLYYTQRVQGTGSVQGDPYVSSINLQAADYTNGDIIKGLTQDGTAYGFYSGILGSGAYTILNAPDKSKTKINNATLSVYGSNGIATNGAIYTTSTNSSIGLIQIGNNSAANTTGNGIGVYGGSFVFEAVGSANLLADCFVFKKWSTNTPTISTSNLKAGILRILSGFGDAQAKDSLGALMLTYPINDTRLDVPGYVGGLWLEPTVTNLGSNSHYGVWQTQGDNYLNNQNGKTVIGATTIKGSAKLDVNSTSMGLLVPRMTTAQRDSIGYISAVTVTSSGTGYTTFPSVTISGGSGSGARVATTSISGGLVGAIQILDAGKQYFGSAPTVTITGGGGTGATATATVHGADSGLVIFNTDINAMQMFDGNRWTSFGKIIKASATLSFGATSAQSSTDLTLTVTGASVGDAVIVGSPTNPANSSWYGFVSSTDTVTIRFNNYSSASITPTASSVFNVKVFKD